MAHYRSPCDHLRHGIPQAQYLCLENYCFCWGLVVGVNAVLMGLGGTIVRHQYPLMRSCRRMRRKCGHRRDSQSDQECQCELYLHASHKLPSNYIYQTQQATYRIL
jgi:hypothetical protein